MIYYDNETQQCVFVCSDPDCEHTTNLADESKITCDAYFSEETYYYTKGFSYYDECIYMLGKGSDSSTSVSLYKISSDGIVRDEVCELFNISDWNNIGVFTVHRGYAFWSFQTSDTQASFFCMDLNNPGDIETVDEVEGFGADYFWLDGSDGYMYFEKTYAVDESYEEYKNTVCRYSLSAKETEELCDVNDSFTVLNDIVYYTKSDNLLYAHNAESESDDTIAELPYDSMLLINDGSNLYLSNYLNDSIDSSEYKVYVLNTDGEIIYTVDLSEFESFVGCDGTNFFARKDGYFLVADCSQIETDEYEWNKLYYFDEDAQICVLNPED
ncbi:MAG: hypothetical protein LUF33_02895 [Clostridiales bacterium]|nr:hypothetical protein [Clostridiales bacterium]